MGLFSKGAKPEPPRRREVLGFVAAAMKEADADPDRDAFLRARDARDAAAAGLTREEIVAGHEALRRHGY
jgi:hypothetical protein